MPFNLSHRLTTWITSWKTPYNEWDTQKAFVAYLERFDSDQVLTKMKQDLIDMKSSQNMGVNLKRKVENFLAAIDVSIQLQYMTLLLYPALYIMEKEDKITWRWKQQYHIQPTIQ